MRTLLYVPVIHMEADLGSIADSVAKRTIAELGEETWARHKETVSGFWDAIIKYFNGIKAANLRVYQDGMVVGGDIGRKIVSEGVKSGSKNYEVLSALMEQGAILEKTEDLAAVIKERDSLVKLKNAVTVRQKMSAYILYKMRKNSLLVKRDGFIADRINRTLKEGETGVLFIGAYHNVIPLLDKDIMAKEIKEVEKIRAYQKMLLYGRKDKEFEVLSSYMISPVDDTLASLS
ncbi:MAG: hypothetical protein Q8J64_10160 [Thermodesulfovibrionales bacterium]|nr:hypothetical protein [Thermodesulfovibrionales bacterium]